MMSDQPDTTAAARTADTTAAALLRCDRCGLVLQDPTTGLLRTVPEEAQNGRCLYCFPLPTPGDIAEMRRLQVEEYRLRVEMARDHFLAGSVPITDDAAATTARTRTAATAASIQCQAMPVTPEQDVAGGRQRKDGEVDAVTARTIDTQADQDRARPRALLKDTRDGHAGQGTIVEKVSASAIGTHSSGGGDNFATAASIAAGGLALASDSESQTLGSTVAAATSAAPAPTVAAPAPAPGAPDGSLLSIVAMFEAQEREEENGGNDEDGGIEEIIMAIDKEFKRDSDGSDGEVEGEGEGEREECANDNPEHRNHHRHHKTTDGKRKVPPNAPDAAATDTEEAACAQKSSPAEDPHICSSDDEESPRKKIRSCGAHTDPLAHTSTNNPLSREMAREIQICVREGTKDNISASARDACIEQLRLRIEEEEESTGMKEAYANTMISLEAPKMIVSALKKVTASYASLKKTKAKKAHARWASECCHTLATIAYHGRAQSVVDCGAVPAEILSALKMNSTRNLKLYLHGIEALQTLSVCAIATDEILENEGLSIISATLFHLQKKGSTKSSRDTKHTFRMIMKLLDNMSSSSQLLTPALRDEEDATRARIIGEKGLLKPALEIMRDFPDEIDLQLAVCGALSSLSADENNCNAIVALGGFGRLVFLSDRHPLRSDVQKAVADCYAWLVADQKNIQLQACEDGVVESCMRLFQNSSHSDSTVVHSALNVLDSICESKECRDYLIVANADSAVTAIAAEAAYSNENDFQLLCQNFLGRLRRDVDANGSL